MSAYKVQVTTTVIEFDRDAAIGNLQVATRRVARFFDDREIVQSKLPTPPERDFPDDYPLEWDDADRNAFFDAVERGEVDFPFKRTGETEDAFGVRSDALSDGSEIVVENMKDHASDVFGDFDDASTQKIYHGITGWIAVATIQEGLVDQLNNSVQEEFQIQNESVAIFKVR